MLLAVPDTEQSSNLVLCSRRKKGHIGHLPGVDYPAWCLAGAIHAADSGNVTVIDSELASNYVKDYFNDAMGGACVVNDTAILSIHNSTVRNNEAQSFGGGVAMGSRR
jgi:hypothetical protein